MTSVRETPVLIVGGGPVGLAASICLAQHGVGSLLVEQHVTTTDHPKATVVNARTYELFRQWGIEDEVRRGGLPPEKSRFIVWATALSGYELGRLDLAPPPSDATKPASRALTGSTSPSVTGICPQDVYERILRRRAEASDLAEVRYGTALESFAADDDGVDAVLRARDGGEQRVRARFVLACDGAASAVRERLGIEMQGPDDIGSLLNVYFHADLTRFIAGRESALYWIVNPDATGVFIALNNLDRWLFNTPIRLASGDAGARFTPEHCRAKIRRAVGDPDLEVDVRSIDPWIMRSQVAARYRAGRVFLLGDAAHRFPPTGGFGMNTGVQDAHNLCWKIAGVLQGWAHRDLLDTYETERRPVGQFNADQSFKNARKMPAPMTAGDARNPLAAIEDDSDEGRALRDMVAAGIKGTREHFSAAGQAKGFRYESAAITPDDGAEEARSTVESYVPTARPGAIAPHFWVRALGTTVSVLDLHADRFVLLAAPRARTLRRAVEDAAGAGGLPLAAYTIGNDLVSDDTTPDAWCTLYGVDQDGAVLLRPDGHVSWRARTSSGGASPLVRAASARAVGRAAAFDC